MFYNFFKNTNIYALNIFTLVFLMHPFHLGGELLLTHRIYIFATSLDFSKIFPVRYTYLCPIFLDS